MDNIDLGPYCSEGDFWAIFAQEDENGDMKMVIPPLTSASTTPVPPAA